MSFSLTDEVREITVSAPTRERSAITSSIRPSAKYALSGSGLRFANGSTTIDFLGGAAGASGASGASAAARNSSTFPKRSAATLDSARSTARRTDPGTPGRNAVSGGTGARTCCDSTENTSGPLKGG